MKPVKKYAAYIVAITVTASLVLWSLAPEPLPVDVGTAVRGDLTVTIDQEGRTRIQERYVVSAPIRGRLSRLRWREGDDISRDTPLATLTPVPVDARTLAQEQARLASALAEKQVTDARVDRARSAFEQAKREHRRADELESQGLKSVQDREQIELQEASASRELDAAVYAAEAAAHAVDAVRAGLMAAAPDAAVSGGAAVVRSPVRGHILRILEQSERIVEAGTPLIEIGEPRNLEIVLDVLSSDAVRIRPGARMFIENWGGTTVLDGRVRTVEPSAFTKVSALGVEEQRVHVVGDLPDPPAELGDGYRVEARIVVWEGQGRLKIPSGAAFRQRSDWFVFVVSNGLARLRRIEAGERNAAEVEVRSGLAEGEMVILHPSDQVADGAAVRVP